MDGGRRGGWLRVQGKLLNGRSSFLELVKIMSPDYEDLRGFDRFCLSYQDKAVI